MHSADHGACRDVDLRRVAHECTEESGILLKMPGLLRKVASLSGKQILRSVYVSIV